MSIFWQDQQADTPATIVSSHRHLGILVYDDHGQQRTKQPPRRNTLHDSFTLYRLVNYFSWTSGGCVSLVSYAEMPSDRDLRRLHLQNVAHLYPLTNDSKQRKSINTADSAQQSSRINLGF
jgi:hypothetical protein